MTTHLASTAQNLGVPPAMLQKMAEDAERANDIELLEEIRKVRRL